VVNRKGVYTDLAKWAKARATRTCAWTASSCRRPLAAHRPLQGTHHRAAGGQPGGGPAREAELRELLSQALDLGKGVLHLLRRWTAWPRWKPAMPPAGHRRAEGVPPSAPARSCGTSYPELDPRMFSYNSKHGWCPGCVGTGLA
jgi:excinuclease ABC subunit A